jgi:uncharacterized repeat protein (TIGR01451 family)
LCALFLVAVVVNLPRAVRSDHLDETNGTIDDIDCVSVAGNTTFPGSLTKLGSSSGPLLPGASFSYQLDLEVGGPGNAVAIQSRQLSDPLPADFLLGSVVENEVAGSTITCSAPPAGSSGTVTCVVDDSLDEFVGSIDVFGTIASDAAPGVLSNTATFDMNHTFGIQARTCIATSTWEIQIVSPANVTGDKTVSGSFVVGGAITYEVVLTNSGPAGQVDAPGNEFTDVLPPELDLDCDAVTIVSGGGVVGCNDGANTVVWNGPIPAGGSVTLSIGATIAGGTPGEPILNQGSFVFDADGDGTSESNGTTDDPGTPPDPDPTALVLGTTEVDEIPTAGAIGLLALALLLAVAALPRLRD